MINYEGEARATRYLPSVMLLILINQFMSTKEQYRKLVGLLVVVVVCYTAFVVAIVLTFEKVVR